MANPFVQYLQDTRGELRHVAWPTRTQTIVYAVLVAALSVGIAVYLGVFDLLFTQGLKNALATLPQNPAALPSQASTSPITVTKETGTTTTVPVAPTPAPSQLPSL
jgi:preprotein translocase SecE subunit